jgi:Zn-finger nucleic acid-binding protein
MCARARSTIAKRRRKPAAASKPASAFEKERARLDRKRETRRRKTLWAHYWLLCPKCGGDMFVQRTLGITWEACRDCHLIAVDGDEVALLLAHRDAGKTLRAILKHSKKPDTNEI